MKETLICPDCGCAMRREIRDKFYSYKGETMAVSGIDGWHCPECSETIFASPEEGARYDAAIREHIIKVNRSLFPDLRSIRKKLRLTQAEAGRLFGGGVTAFSRYESGKIEPPVALVKLFKVLDRHPELLAEVK